MIVPNAFRFFAGLLIFLSASHVFATSISKQLLIENQLSYSEAKKLGLKAEITSTAVRSGLLEFRISVPEKINENKVESMLSEIFSAENSVALIHLNSYSEEKSSILSVFGKHESVYQKYFYMNINPKIIDRVVLNVFCSEGYVYIINIETKKL